MRSRTRANLLAAAVGGGEDRGAEDLDEQPSEVGKGSVQSHRLGRAPISSLPVDSAVAIAPVAADVPSVAVAAATTFAREERDEGARVVSLGRSGCCPRVRRGVSETRWNGAFRGESDGAQNWPGLNERLLNLNRD
jgi:hypothetical protein